MTIRYGGVIAGQAEIDAVTAVLGTQQWSAGPVTTQFENRFANYVGANYGVATNSGSSALLLALASLHPYSRVVIPALQFPTLYSACVWASKWPRSRSCSGASPRPQNFGFIAKRIKRREISSIRSSPLCLYQRTQPRTGWD